VALGKASDIARQALYKGSSQARGPHMIKLAPRRERRVIV